MPGLFGVYYKRFVSYSPLLAPRGTEFSDIPIQPKKKILTGSCLVYAFAPPVARRAATARINIIIKARFARLPKRGEELVKPFV